MVIQETIGTIVAVDGADVEIELPPPGCGRCDEPGGCGGGRLSLVRCVPAKRYRLRNVLDAKVGETVRVGVPVVAVRMAAFRAYMVPLLALLLGAFLGGSFGSVSSALGGFVGLAAAWLWLIRIRRGPHETPRLIGRGDVNGP